MTRSIRFLSPFTSLVFYPVSHWIVSCWFWAFLIRCRYSFSITVWFVTSLASFPTLKVAEKSLISMMPSPSTSCLPCLVSFWRTIFPDWKYFPLRLLNSFSSTVQLEFTSERFEVYNVTFHARMLSSELTEVTYGSLRCLRGNCNCWKVHPRLPSRASWRSQLLTPTIACACVALQGRETCKSCNFPNLQNYSSFSLPSWRTWFS